MKMDPITWAAIAVVVSAAAGFGAGWGLKPDASVEALEAQTAAIATLNEGNQNLVSEVQRVAMEEAERETLLADKLTDVPPQCVEELGGDPMSAVCAWAWCVRDGESNAQRCQEQTLQAYLISEWKAQSACPDTQE
jgi:hypothetical protein